MAEPPGTLEITLLYFAEGWRFLVRGQRFGRYDYKVDALRGLPRLLDKLKRRGWGGRPVVLVQDRFGELMRMPV